MCCGSENKILFFLNSVCKSIYHLTSYLDTIMKEISHGACIDISKTEKSSAEICWIMIGPEDAAKLRIENIFHLDSIVNIKKEEKRKFLLHKLQKSINWCEKILPDFIALFGPFLQSFLWLFCFMILYIFHQWCEHLEPIGSFLEFFVVQGFDLVLWWRQRKFHESSSITTYVTWHTESSFIIAPVLQPCWSVTSAKSEYGWSPK